VDERADGERSPEIQRRDGRTERCTASVKMSALLSAITAIMLGIVLWMLFG
jgi:hypothetical protein